jgi:hypothetical protein
MGTVQAHRVQCSFSVQLYHFSHFVSVNMHGKIFIVNTESLMWMNGLQDLLDVFLIVMYTI